MNLRTLLLQMSVFDFGLSDMRNWQCTLSHCQFPASLCFPIEQFVEIRKTHIDLFFSLYILLFPSGSICWTKIRS